MVGLPSDGAKNRGVPKTGLPRWFLETKAAVLTRADITTVLELGAERGLTVKVNRWQAMIAAALSWGLAEGLLKSNEARGIRRRFEENVRERSFTSDELAKIWHGISTLKAEESTKLATRLYVATPGLRPKELCSLKRKNVRLDDVRPMLTVEKGEAKNRVEHVVPLSALSVELLREAMSSNADSEWVFPSAGGAPLTAAGLSRAIVKSRALDETLFGVPDAQLYDVKHTMITFLGDAGHTNDAIGVLFNHLTATKGSTTGKSYNHSRYLSLKTELVGKWAAYLDRTVGRTAASGNVLSIETRRENVGA